MTPTQPITVFGATGRIGQELLCRLAQAQVPTIAVTRELAKAIPLPAVEWRVADLGDRASLYPVLAGSRAVFLLSGHSPSFVEEQANAIDVAQELAVPHLVKLSSGAAAKDSASPVARQHGQVEEHLRAARLAWTLLRPEGFMQNWLGPWAKTVQHERRIYEATGEGQRPYLDLRDIADVACAILTDPAPHAGRTYALTGGEALSYGQVAVALGAAIGAEVAFVPITAAEARQRLTQKGLPLGVIHTLLDYAEAQRTGQAAHVSPAVADILHRPARTVAAFLGEHAAWFR